MPKKSSRKRTKRYNSLSDLQDAYESRVKRDTKEDYPPEMTFKQFADAWEDSGHLKDRHNGQNGYMMMRVDLSKPLAIDNYQIIKRKDYKYHLHKASANAAILGPKIAKARIGKKHSQTTKDQIAATLFGNSKTDDHKERISASLTGKAKSAITKAKMARTKMLIHKLGFLETTAIRIACAKGIMLNDEI